MRELAPTLPVVMVTKSEEDSTLKEASSWGKVDTTYEQMVFSEATIAVPLIAGYAYHKRGWEQRPTRRFADLYADEPQPVATS